MTEILNLARSLHNDDSGAAFIEYTVLLGVILAVAIAVITSVGTWGGARWVNLDNQLKLTP